MFINAQILRCHVEPLTIAFNDYAQALDSGAPANGSSIVLDRVDDVTSTSAIAVLFV